jgi:hypothetical protein
LYHFRPSQISDQLVENHSLATKRLVRPKGQQKKTEITHKGPSAAKPQPKKKQDIHHEGREDPSAAEPQPKESEYLPQRRKGAK